MIFRFIAQDYSEGHFCKKELKMKKWFIAQAGV